MFGDGSNPCPLHGDAVQPPHALLPPSPPTLNLSQHQAVLLSLKKEEILIHPATWVSLEDLTLTEMKQAERTSDSTTIDT